MQTQLALKDIKEGFFLWNIWLYLAKQDIKQRYRRSVIGPLWVTINMGITIGAVGIVYAKLFHMEIAGYLPFLCAGMIIWSLVSTIITESCGVFINAEQLIKQIKLPYSTHVYRSICRNLLIFAHHFIIYVIVALIFKVNPWGTLYLLIPAFILLALNGLWLGLMLGLFCARYRDAPQIVTSALQVLFLVTPILWKAETITTRTSFILFNPLYHVIEIARLPLLGHNASLLSWTIVLGLTLVGMVISFVFYSFYRKRISYWM